MSTPHFWRRGLVLTNRKQRGTIRKCTSAICTLWFRESFYESGEGVRFPRERADLRGSPGNFRGSPGNFRGSLGDFRGTPGLLQSSTVRELPGKSPKKFRGSLGNFRGSPGTSQKLGVAWLPPSDSPTLSPNDFTGQGPGTNALAFNRALLSRENNLPPTAAPNFRVATKISYVVQVLSVYRRLGDPEFDFALGRWWWQFRALWKGSFGKGFLSGRSYRLQRFTRF